MRWHLTNSEISFDLMQPIWKGFTHENVNVEYIKTRSIRIIKKHKDRHREVETRYSSDSTTFSFENNFDSSSFGIELGHRIGSLIDATQIKTKDKIRIRRR